MEQVDVIFYINLESRIDRNIHFLAEIKKLCIDECKIIRIDAIKDSNGALGCTKSHIKALELFMANPLWDTCMVFEDDFTFFDTSFKNNNELIKTFFYPYVSFFPLILICYVSGRSYFINLIQGCTYVLH